MDFKLFKDELIDVLNCSLGKTLPGGKNEYLSLSDFDREIECSFEAKSSINDSEILKRALNVLSTFQLVSSNYRNEIHSLHMPSSDGSYFSLVQVQGESLPWVKIKKNNNIYYSRNKFPIVGRSVQKFKPTSCGYNLVLDEIKKTSSLFDFKKFCANVYFCDEEYLYSLSISIAENANLGFYHAQIELEYEGSRRDMPKCKRHEILDILDEILIMHFPFLIDNLTGKTKLQELSLIKTEDAMPIVFN